MHVAIIMDGNGRWAEQRGLPRKIGHKAGAKAARKVIEQATREPAVECLTLYAFSSDNWSRPRDEVIHLMRLFKWHLQNELARCIENGVRLNIIGRRDRLNPTLIRAIEDAEAATAGGTNLLLRVAVDYSARDAVARSAHRRPAGCGCGPAGHIRDCFETALAAEIHSATPVRDVDLLIRSGGERRLSDFLLWECAYAELVFIDTWWPDFSEGDLIGALTEFSRRQRRFGGLPVVA